MWRARTKSKVLGHILRCPSQHIFLLLHNRYPRARPQATRHINLIRNHQTYPSDIAPFHLLYYLKNLRPASVWIRIAGNIRRPHTDSHRWRYWSRLDIDGIKNGLPKIIEPLLFSIYLNSITFFYYKNLFIKIFWKRPAANGDGALLRKNS